MNDSLKNKRPLSPHLQVYKIQITSLLSILHRGTGMVLFGGAILCSVWFITLAQGPEAYGAMQGFLLHPVGLIMLFGLSFSFFYHLCNGIRHLLWDAGIGYEMVEVRKTGWTVVIFSFVLTGFAWILGILCGRLLS
jgi:succinate dehydrogenase / fumarate reductase cytochrome b subunit